MTNKTVDPVDLCELRIERRRAQLQRDWEEAREYVSRKNRWTPLFAVAGMAALGAGLSRITPGSTAHAAARPVRRSGFFGALAAMLTGGVRFAMSPTGRALWTSFNQARRRPSP